MVRNFALLSAMSLVLISAFSTAVEAQSRRGGFGGGGWSRPYNPPQMGASRPFVQSAPAPAGTSYTLGQKNSLSGSFNSQANPGTR